MPLFRFEEGAEADQNVLGLLSEGADSFRGLPAAEESASTDYCD